MAAIGGHPYSPSDIELPGFVPQQLSPLQLVVPLIGTSLLVITVIWLVSGRVLNTGRSARLSKADRLIMCWWAITGLTNLIIEASFLFTPNYLTKESPSFFDEIWKSSKHPSSSPPITLPRRAPVFFDEIWKEYSKADSRYASRDTTIVAIEVIAVFLRGPASLLAMYVCLLHFTTTHFPFITLSIPGRSENIRCNSIVFLKVGHNIYTRCLA
uniref:EXPERA domain-containing protein n=1 Tax=Aegilops tauschii TaxID=37682 RepID=M8CS66_AEGTA